jgi:hypothetical protein
VTDNNQRTLAASSQLSLLNQVITLIREDLLDLENKDVLKAISELRQLVGRLTLEA